MPNSFLQIRHHINRVALISVLCSIYGIIMLFNSHYFRTETITKLYYHAEDDDTGFRYSVFGHVPVSATEAEMELIVIEYHNMTVLPYSIENYADYFVKRYTLNQFNEFKGEYPLSFFLNFFFFIVVL